MEVMPDIPLDPNPTSGFQGSVPEAWHPHSIGWGHLSNTRGLTCHPEGTRVHWNSGKDSE